MLNPMIDEQLAAELATLSVIPDYSIGRAAKPSWLKTQGIHGDRLYTTKRNLRSSHLFTVCEEAKCPNIGECLNSGTATFMILGDTCTRACKFCHVKTGDPEQVIDTEEPQQVALLIKEMRLSYAVITMVDRDDLPDSGSLHLAKTVEAIKYHNPGIIVEVLSGDLQGVKENLETVLLSPEKGYDVFAHNIETVRSRTRYVRDARASYEQTLSVLRMAKQIKPSIYTKSSLMLGLGETLLEVAQTLQDLKDVGVDIVTLGQYLQPTPKHLKVKRFAHPQEFEYWNHYALQLGFKAVHSGPLSRSSYKAAHLFPGLKSH